MCKSSKNIINFIILIIGLFLVVSVVGIYIRAMYWFGIYVIFDLISRKYSIYQIQKQKENEI